MKIQYYLILTFLFCYSCTISFAQRKDIPVRFANGDFITGSNISNHTFKIEDISSALFATDYYVLVQFSSIPSVETKQKMTAAGIALGSYLPGNAYFAIIKNSVDFRRAKEFNISSINTLPLAYKIHRQLQNYKPTRNKEEVQAIAVSFFEPVDIAMATGELKKAGAIILSSKFDAAGMILIQYNPAVINTIATFPFVSSLQLQPVKDKALNYNSRAAHGVSGLNALNGKNLNGKGVTVGVGDNADISTHIDFSGRLINRNPTVPSDHGTHTSGTTAGAGIINIKNRGMAAKAAIVSQYFSDIIVNAPAYLTDYDMVLSNNSYHAAESGCAGEGEYNVLSKYADKQINTNGQLLHVFAAGNDGDLTCSPYPAHFGTLKSGWQCSKNILTVGALNVSDNTIASYSSRGPVQQDGRIKPEITADGYAVLSTNSNNTYGYNYGTSMACPAVTGSLTLMYERYRQLHAGADPKSALIKALACNTAEDLGNSGPDFTYGFGMLNTRRGVDAIDSSRYFINSITEAGNATHNITIPPNTRRVKIMLYWADVAAASSAGMALVNDLDMVVIEPSLTLHRPLVLNTTPANVNNIATEAPDHLNNIEQVVIENPAAGIYAANITGYNIPFGPQEYVVAYEIIKNGVTVEYPFGGETWVPGETENIRWNAYGNESNTFTIEYSPNSGGSWTTIDNNVAATTRVYPWAVPAAATNAALIRVSRNGTALSDQSNFNFSILGQPTVTATNVCEGAVQLDWPAVTAASSYTILQLVNDSMQVIGNTSSNSYLITGLDKNKIYWLGVVAKNTTVAGRRSVSVKTQPNSGPCTLAAFNNDLKVDSIVEPTTARQLFSNAANATKPVKISIKNIGTASVSGPFTASFNYGGATVTETINTTINAGASYTYTFTGTYPIIAAGYQYNFKAWVTKATDNNHLNDTAYKTVKYINNDAISVMPLTENFESMPAVEIVSPEMAFGGNKYLDFMAGSSRGRARTFVNTGMAYSSSKALTLDQTPYSVNSNADSAVLNYNLSAYAGKQMRFDFYYKNQGQADAPGNRVWIRGSENNNWIEAYNLFDNQGGIGQWKKALFNISDLLSTANPPQTITPTFQIKIGQEGNASANNPNPEVDIDDGYTYDNLIVNEAVNDVALLNIIAPAKGGCGLTAGNPISIKIKNYNNATLNNLQVNYQINGAAIVTETIASIAPNQALDYVFAQTADLSAYIDYDIKVWVKYATDNYASNDSIVNYLVHNSPVISNYPYLQSFENDNGGFYTTGTNSTWQWGAPAKTIINKAPNGSKAWVTNLNGNYADNETSYLVSPCFDLTGLRKPVLSFSHIFDVELDYDYTWVEYSLDGKTWQKLGAANNGTNWYDNAALNNWRASKTTWHVASIDIPVSNATVKFRFVMSSDGGVTQEGVGIDDVAVHEKADIADYIPAQPVVSAQVSGNNWVPFNWGDSINGPWYVLAEINANGQNLGTVNVLPYLSTTGITGNSNNQYYANRNYVISSTNSPTGNINVRLYLTDAEANALINATGCVSCTKPTDAYELGVDKYRGSPQEENGTPDDNFNGYYQFIVPANTQIIPHGNGYYAEFSINNFSEFWFSKGDITPPAVSVCAGNIITYTAPSGGTVYQWQADTGSGYSNISDGPVYTGTSNDSLLLNNVPTSFTGYKYRCVVDGVNKTEFTLRFKNLWTGTASTNWFTAANWSCNTVPDSNTDVIVPGGLTRYPVLTSNTAIRSIRVLAGVPVVINAGVVLDVNGR